MSLAQLSCRYATVTLEGKGLKLRDRSLFLAAEEVGGRYLGGGTKILPA